MVLCQLRQEEKKTRKVERSYMVASCMRVSQDTLVSVAVISSLGFDCASRGCPAVHTRVRIIIFFGNDMQICIYAPNTVQTAAGEVSEESGIRALS